MLLVAEMALFMLLIVPLPFTIRRKMFTFMFVVPHYFSPAAATDTPLEAKVDW